MIKDDKFLIREIKSDDLNNFYQLIDENRDDIKEYLSGLTSKTKTLIETKMFIDDVLISSYKKNYYIFLIIDSLTNNIVMFFDLKNIDWSIPKAELGCFIDRNYKGKGLTETLLHNFLEYCFYKFKFTKVFLRTHETNLPMKTIAEKCGFVKEGKLRCDYKTSSGKIVDLIYYGLLSNEFKKLQKVK
ncbi:GNAT family N-acetyltransferase [Flavivirga sp. 57AJ16]|uniref:GNAT family N-acetyltransferase n=1 Tax=Flavivirga sp. 57AJ16 TaxID=3025307 RepID=UPI0023660980|nr:GNAT family protein [Flavivirga sp. 57AJ16]MDD7886207.1 GNAT family protein [Flavivirga sp. 57AJ16]